MAYSTIPLEVSNEQHRSALVRMWTENLSDPRIGEVAPQRLQWFYEDNPVGPPRTFLSVNGSDQEIVGCGSTLRRRMWAMGRMVEAGIPCDFAVMKKHRLGGAAMGIQRALTVGSHAAGQEFLFGFPNKLSLPVLKRIGYQIVSDAQGWVKPLHSEYKLTTYLKNPLLAKAAGFGLDVALRTVDVVRVPPWPRAWDGEILDRADARFDELWARARDRYPIIGEKSATFLNWRYAGFTSRRFQFYAIADRATGALGGFLVFTVTDNKAYIVDLFTEDLDYAFDHLIVKFARAMRRAGNIYIHVSFSGQVAFERRLKQLGFFRTQEPNRSLVVFVEADTPRPLAGSLLDRENWFMFDGEMDI